MRRTAALAVIAVVAVSCAIYLQTSQSAPLRPVEIPSAQDEGSDREPAFAENEKGNGAEPILVQGNAARSWTFDYYVLALSWSPEFCAKQTRSSHIAQCERNDGFVVHGLWPQFEKGFPTYCAPKGREPTRMALDTVRGVFPDEGLARYQWRKHGSCTGLAPGEYFVDVRAARAAIKIPAAYARPGLTKTVRLQELKRAFVDATRGLRADMINVQCHRGTLQEIRICFDKTLKTYRSCGADMRDSCGYGDITVPSDPRSR